MILHDVFFGDDDVDDDDDVVIAYPTHCSWTAKSLDDS